MFGTIIGIFGIIATVILGFYSIVVTKRAKKISSLTIRKNECFSLFDVAVKKLKIDIKYADKKIENPLILFKGEIYNSGTIDIDKTSIYEPFKIIASDNYSWLEVNLTNENSKINSKIQKISEKEISFNWDLLKKNEKIQFEALIESKVSENEEIIKDAIDFYDTLNFSYRITNLDKIICDDKFDESKFINKKIGVSFIFFFVFLLFGIFVYLIPQVNKKIRSADFYNMYFELYTQNNDSIILSTIIPIFKDKLLLKDINDNTIEILSLDNFINKYHIVSIKTTRESFTFHLVRILSIIIVLSGILYFALDYFRIRRKKSRKITS